MNFKHRSFDLTSVTVILSLSDENFGKLVSGSGKAQQMFMSGKLKVKGNIMKGKLDRAMCAR